MDDYGRIIIVGILGLLFLYSAIVSLWPHFFPIKFDVQAGGLTLHWRGIKTQNTLTWPADQILSISARRIRIKQAILKRRGLVIEDRRAQRLVFSAGAAELETIAQHLRQALNLSAHEPPAMTPAPPPRCRFKRNRFQGGVHIAIPPPRNPFLFAAVLLFSLFTATLCYFYLTHLLGAGYSASIDGLLVILALFAALAVLFIFYFIFDNFRRKTIIAANPSRLMILERSMIRPLTVEIPVARLSKLAVLKAPTRPVHYQINIASPNIPDLVICRGQRPADLMWLVEVLNLALKPSPQTVSTANATPPPAHTAPHSPDPAPQ